MTFVVKVDRLGSKVEVRGLAAGDDKIYRFEKNVRDVVRSAGLPLRITITEGGEEDRGDLVGKLRGAFVSDLAIEGECPFPYSPSTSSAYVRQAETNKKQTQSTT